MTSRGGSNAPLPPHGAASASCGPTATTGPSIDAGAAASSSASNATLPAPGSALPPHGAASASCGPTTTTGPSIEAGAAASSSTSNATLPAPGSASASRGLTTAPSSPSSQTSCSATISLVIPVTPRFFERYAEVKELARSFASIRGGLQRIWDGVETLGGLKTIPGVFNWISSVLDSVGDVWEGSYQAINTLASHSLPSTVHCYPKPHRLLGHSSAYGLHTILEHRVLTRSHLDSSMLVYVNGLPRPKTVPGVKIVTSLAELTDEVEMYMKDASSVQLLDIPDGISLELAKKMWEYVLANKAVGILRPESRLGHICKAAALLEDEKDKVQRQIVILNARLRRLEDDISNLAVNSSSKQSSNV